MESKQHTPTNKMPRTLTDKLKNHLSTIGKKGGSKSTPAKVTAAIENGKKGGRPKKAIAHEAA
jgi:general stress protein YciG